MPNPNAYKQAFGLKQGMILYGYKLISLSVEHEPIVQYSHYEYPTTMTWQKTSAITNVNSRDFLQKLQTYLAGDKTVVTAYGNPYNCNFGNLSLVQDQAASDTFQIKALGSCVRV